MSDSRMREFGIIISSVYYQPPYPRIPWLYSCSSGQRECSMFYFNEGSRLLLASLWRPLFDLTFLRLSISYDQRWGVARKKVW